MIILHFEEQDKKIEVNYALLKAIAENMPQNEQYSSLVDAIFELGIPSLSTSLANNRLLSLNQRDKLWDMEDISARRVLVSDREFLEQLTDKQAQEIITADDVEILKYIANYAELLYPKEGSLQASRLSGAMADSLLEHIAKHSDSSVRQALAENSETPSKFRPTIADMLKMGINGWYHYELSNLSRDDVRTLKSADREILEYCANNIEDVKNSSIRKELSEFIVSYPDAGLRLSLAENTRAPIFILKKLLHDADDDIIASAKKNLTERDIFDFDDNI